MSIDCKRPRLSDSLSPLCFSPGLQTFGQLCKYLPQQANVVLFNRSGFWVLGAASVCQNGAIKVSRERKSVLFYDQRLQGVPMRCLVRFLGGETWTWLPNEGLFHGGCAVRAIGYSYVTLQGFVPFMQISQPRCRPSSRDTQRRGHYSRWLVSEAPPNDVMNLSRGQQDPTQVCRRH